MIACLITRFTPRHPGPKGRARKASIPPTWRGARFQGACSSSGSRRRDQVRSPRPRKALLALAAGTALVLAVVVPAAPVSAATTHIWPVCTSKTNESGWRYSTRTNHSPSHYNVDINWGSGADDRGRWVVASAAGTIVAKGDAGVSSYGKNITLRHADGTYSRYAHLEWYTSLGVNSSVVQGQLIGTIGYHWDGSTRQYHLHYEQMNAYRNQKAVYINGASVYYYGTRAFFPTHVRPSCP